MAAACEGDAELRSEVELLLGFESSTEEIGNPTAPAGFTGVFHEAPTVALSYEQQQELQRVRNRSLSHYS
jgi:hypothetical protein